MPAYFLKHHRVFKLFDNPKGLEDFMADREQDIPKDRN